MICPVPALTSQDRYIKPYTVMPYNGVIRLLLQVFGCLSVSALFVCSGETTYEALYRMRDAHFTV